LKAIKSRVLATKKSAADPPSYLIIHANPENDLKIIGLETLVIDGKGVKSGALFFALGRQAIRGNNGQKLEVCRCQNR